MERARRAWLWLRLACIALVGVVGLVAFSCTVLQGEPVGDALASFAPATLASAALGALTLWSHRQRSGPNGPHAGG